MAPFLNAGTSNRHVIGPAVVRSITSTDNVTRAPRAAARGRQRRARGYARPVPPPPLLGGMGWNGKGCKLSPTGVSAIGHSKRVPHA
eukprot:7380474-Prymnesium_polylepis.1